MNPELSYRSKTNPAGAGFTRRADITAAPTVVVIIAQILAGATAATGRGSRANIATGATIVIVAAGVDAGSIATGLSR